MNAGTEGRRAKAWTDPLAIFTKPDSWEPILSVVDNEPQRVEPAESKSEDRSSRLCNEGREI